MRKDFRTFRLDRMEELRPLERTFVQRRGQRLEDFLRQVKERRVG